MSDSILHKDILRIQEYSNINDIVNRNVILYEVNGIPFLISWSQVLLPDLINNKLAYFKIEPLTSTLKENDNVKLITKFPDINQNIILKDFYFMILKINFNYIQNYLNEMEQKIELVMDGYFQTKQVYNFLTKLELPDYCEDRWDNIYSYDRWSLKSIYDKICAYVENLKELRKFLLINVEYLL